MERWISPLRSRCVAEPPQTVARPWWRTPHLRHERWWNGDRDELERLLQAVRDGVGDGLTLYMGGEIAVHTESFDEILEQPEGVVSLAGSRYLLLELDWQGLGPKPEAVLYELNIAKWISVLAHPERVSWLMEDRGLVTRLVGSGALTQLTAGSITGELGRQAQDASYWLLENGMAHFVASDAHDLDRRSPGLSKAYHEVRTVWGDDVADELFVHNPRAVIENRPLPVGAASVSEHLGV